MKKRSGLTATILKLIALTAVMICVIITVAGALMIYYATEEGIKNEVNYAAHSLYLIYDTEYHGEYYMKNGSLYKGSSMLSNSEFQTLTNMISSTTDVDFTIFWDKKRIFTTVKRSDGSFITGTSADDKVIETVLGRGLECYFSGVTINDRKYAGYYIPITDSSAKVVGMIFAGRPMDAARSNMRNIITVFTVISGVVLLVVLVIFKVFSSKLVKGLIEVRDFMEKVSSSDFGADLSPDILSRTDEIGDIACSANALRYSLRDLVERDPLTSLLNRRSCRKSIDRLIERNMSYSVAMADIDYFKKINDGYGHACGDMVLKELSAMLRERSEKQKGFASRWGGEEFLIILPDTELSAAKDFLEKLITEIRSSEYMWEGKRVPVTVTIGAVEMKKGETPDDTINRADHLLYEGKESGRNRLVAQ